MLMEVDAGGIRFVLDDDGLELLDAAGVSVCRLNLEETQRIRDLLNGDFVDLPNRRSVFRVPVFEYSGLTCQTLIQGQEYTVRIRNISLTGISLEIPDSQRALIAEDTEVGITLSFEGEKVVLKGIVRRMMRHAVGVLFPDCIQNENLSPPPRLVRIVMLLQRQWMSRKTPRPQS